MLHTTPHHLHTYTNSAFELVLAPIIAEFDPQLVIISAGFDAASGDPLGRWVEPGPGVVCQGCLWCCVAF